MVRVLSLCVTRRMSLKMDQDDDDNDDDCVVTLCSSKTHPKKCTLDDFNTFKPYVLL